MSSGITLTAGVRQNLLSLQNTADLMATTQQRLATGKKVNSALDNPSNFFTSQSLNDRASDLNALLDSIGQATQTLGAANNGITSITQLVQSAKSIAQQARQSTASIDNYGAVDVSGTIANAPSSTAPEVLGSLQGADLSPRDVSLSFTNQAETLGAVTGTSAGSFAGAGTTVDTGNDGNIVLTINKGDGTARDVSIAVATTDTIATTIGKINAAVDAGGSDANEAGTIHASNAAGHIALTALGSNVDFSIKTGAGGSTANTLTATGLATTSGSGTSTSLLDNIIAAGGSAGATFALTTNCRHDAHLHLRSDGRGKHRPDDRRVQYLAERQRRRHDCHDFGHDLLAARRQGRRQYLEARRQLGRGEDRARPRHGFDGGCHQRHKPRRPRHRSHFADAHLQQRRDAG